MDGKLYHEHCTHHLGHSAGRGEHRPDPVCAGCNLPVTAGQVDVEALGSSYHAACFKCAGCFAPLEGTFVKRNAKPHHKECGK